MEKEKNKKFDSSSFKKEEKSNLAWKKEAKATKEIVKKDHEIEASAEESQNKAETNFKARRKVKKVISKPKTEFSEKIVDIARVTKVVKGGRRFSFSAFVVVGNKKGKVGYGHGKANEVPDAIKKAIKDAQNHLITVPIINESTVPHEMSGKFLSSKVIIKSAPKGKGIIASGAVRAVMELAGYTDIYAKSYGSRTKMNTVKATVETLKKMRTVEEIAALRGLKVQDIIS